MKLWVSIFFFIFSNKLLTQIYINEIFPAPNSNQTEWIEIINPSESSLFFDGLIITNRNTATKILKPIIIPPHSFFVILKDTIGFSSFISCNYIIFNLPTLHNDWDILTIRGSDSALIDSVYYSSKLVKQGFSIERFDWSEPGPILNNWNISTNPNYHTMCLPNSKRINEFEIFLLPKFTSGNCILHIVNLGRTEIKTFEVSAELNLRFRQENINQKIFSKEYYSLKKRDTIIIDIPLKDYLKNEQVESIQHLKIDLTYDSLSSKSKRTIIIQLSTPKQFTGVLINEFLFDVYTGCGEFIELVNTTSDTIDLSYWKIINSSVKQLEITANESNTKILPFNYFVIFWDSSFFNCFENLINKDFFYFAKSGFSLRNTGDQIILLNKLGIIQDSLSYFPEWHKGRFTSFKQKSLEKQIPTSASFKSENWFTSVDPKGATPGEINSVSLQKNNEISLTIEPNPFSPRSNSKAQTTISYVLPFRQARINARIFDLNGSEIFLLANNQITPSAGQLFWDGYTNFGEKVKPGGYVLYFEAIDLQSGDVTSIKTTIAVGW